jgi:hypothetical protein
MANVEGKARCMGDHLAIMKPEPLRKLLSGEKRIESRFSRVKCPPHGRVRRGDRIHFKESGGPVRCVVAVAETATFRLNGPEDVESLRRIYGRWILANDAYWEAKRESRWATLICLEPIRRHAPYLIEKRDRRPWILLDDVSILRRRAPDASEE